MKVKCSCQRSILLLLVICSIFCISGNGYCEVISIEEFLRVNMATKTVTQVYYHKFTEDIKGYIRGTDFFVVNNSSGENIFNSKGELQITFTPESRMFVGEFLQNKNMFYGTIRNDTGKYVRGIFELDGTPVRTYTIPNISPSPGGEYFHTRCSMVSSGPIRVYDKNGDMSFNIPIQFECQVSAPSDSQLIVLHHQSLSLWDVNTGQEIWQSTIPNEEYFTDSAFDMAFSVKNNIIAVRNMNSCYCFDFQGNYLWGQDRLESNKLINMIGVSDDDGKVLITAITPGIIDVYLFNRDGSLSLETGINLGPDCYFAANVATIADVSDNFMLIRFKELFGNERILVTGILYFNGSDWLSAVLDGEWDLHKSAQGEYTLAGLRRYTNEIMAYSIK